MLSVDLTGQLVSRKSQAIEIPQNRDRDVLRPEELICQLLQLFGSHALNFFDEFVQAVEMVEIHFLASEV